MFSVASLKFIQPTSYVTVGYGLSHYAPSRNLLWSYSRPDVWLIVLSGRGVVRANHVASTQRGHLVHPGAVLAASPRETHLSVLWLWSLCESTSSVCVCLSPDSIHAVKAAENRLQCQKSRGNLKYKQVKEKKRLFSKQLINWLIILNLVLNSPSLFSCIVSVPLSVLINLDHRQLHKSYIPT